MIPKTVATLLLAVTISPWLLAGPVEAQAMRTYVSGLGRDGNPCTASSPCRTFQTALAKTLPGGQIFALDSADFGSVTINQAVSITGSDATGVLAMSGVSGITVNAGTNDDVNLKGLLIDGAGLGASGILFNSGASLNVQDCVIRAFVSFGIGFQPSGSSALSVVNTLVSNNADTGIMFQNTGSGSSVAILNDVQAINNGTGISALGTSSGPANVTVQNSVVANNSAVGILSGGLSTVSVANSTVANNGVGLSAQNAGAMLNVAQSTVTGNGIGWQVANGGQVISSGTNSIGGNVTGNNAPPTTPAPTATPTPTPPPPVATNYLLDGSGAYLLDSNGAKVTAL